MLLRQDFVRLMARGERPLHGSVSTVPGPCTVRRGPWDGWLPLMDSMAAKPGNLRGIARDESGNSIVPRQFRRLLEDRPDFADQIPRKRR